MRRTIPNVAICAVFLGPSALLAQHAQDSQPIGDAQAIVKIDLLPPYGTSSPPKISGTNVNVQVSCFGDLHDGASLSVVDCHVTTGGEELGLPAGWHGGNVRLASTHFPDSVESTSFVVLAQFQYEDPQHGFSGNAEVEATLTLSPYNKVFRYGTIVGENGKFNSWMGTASNMLCNNVDLIMPALQHGIVPPLVPAHDFMHWDTYDILDALKKATVQINIAHGYPLTYFPSDLIAGPSPNPAHAQLRYISDLFLPPSNIEPATAQGVVDGNPRFNLVYHWSCAVLDQLNPSQAMQWVQFPENRAMVGFTETVNCMMKEGDRSPDILQSAFDSYAGDHAHVFMNTLLTGGRLDVCLEEANQQYPPRGASHLVGGIYKRPLLDMTPTLNSDLKFRLKSVYLKDGVEESSCLASRGTIDTWYWVTP